MNIEVLNKFRQINKLAAPDGIVFVGSDYFASLPLGELATAFRLDEKLYNRSVSGATVKDVCKMIDECVLDLRPSKVFFNFGDAEIREGVDIEEFIASYEWLLYTIHNKCDAEIYVVSVTAQSELAIEMNLALSRLCGELGCKFIDISSALCGTNRELRVFDTLKLHMCRNLDFVELMTII